VNVVVLGTLNTINGPVAKGPLVVAVALAYIDVPGINPCGAVVVTVIVDGDAALLVALATGMVDPEYKSPFFTTVVDVYKDCALTVPTTPLAKYVIVVVVGAETTIKLPSARLYPAILFNRPDTFTTDPAIKPCTVENVTVIKLLEVLVVVKSVVTFVTTGSTPGKSYALG
jgi:hypothetical protein